MTTMQGALILIVEDEVELAEIFRGFFEREGFRVVLAHDGRTGVALHSQLSPRLVVLGSLSVLVHLHLIFSCLCFLIFMV